MEAVKRTEKRLRSGADLHESYYRALVVSACTARDLHLGLLFNDGGSPKGKDPDSPNPSRGSSRVVRPSRNKTYCPNLIVDRVH